ncbi:MAG: GntR family transcriptional regulator [Acidobacteriota bacterium]
MAEMSESGAIPRGKFGEVFQGLAEKRSLADRIAAGIRELILSGELNPGDRIVESSLARELGVGQPTVREALFLLEHQGLVVRRANQGCMVTTLSEQEIAQILQVRNVLELLAVELAVQNAKDEELHRLIAISGMMRSAAEQKNLREFYDRDFEYHRTLWEASGNPFLSKLLSQVMLPLFAFLFIRNMRNSAQVGVTASASAHAEIAQAILTRDPVLARKVAEQKFQTFASHHLNMLSGANAKAGK